MVVFVVFLIVHSSTFPRETNTFATPLSSLNWWPLIVCWFGIPGPFESKMNSFLAYLLSPHSSFVMSVRNLGWIGPWGGNGIGSPSFVTTGAPDTSTVISIVPGLGSFGSNGVGTTWLRAMTAWIRTGKVFDGKLSSEPGPAGPRD